MNFKRRKPHGKKDRDLSSWHSEGVRKRRRAAVECDDAAEFDRLTDLWRDEVEAMRRQTIVSPSLFDKVFNR